MFKLTKLIKSLKFSRNIRVYLLDNLAEMNNTINLAFLEILVNKLKLRGIYITLNKPYTALIVDLKRRKIDREKIFIIDCITGKLSNALKKKKNCIFVQNPESLFELSHIMSEIKKTGKYKFVFIDSAITLFLKAPEKEVINFIKFHAYKTTHHLDDYMIVSSIDHAKTKNLFRILSKEFRDVKLIESKK